MTVTTVELREITNRLLDHLEASGLAEVEIEEDFYWNIPGEEMYKPYVQPQDLDMGQLADDMVEIRKILSDESPPVGYALVWLAAILRRVGEKVIC